MSSDSVSKVTAARLSRDAYLYIRQSTLYQVINNTESTARQYDLQGRALTLGWPAERIHVIDIDQGHSGASAADREGFRHLVAEVSLGRAGIVLGLECSRLARDSADWQQLIKICAHNDCLIHNDTLICDEDGLYDPASFNDRLLLGLICPRLSGVVNVINGAADAPYPSSMILYLPLAGNVGNEGARGPASPALAGHARDHGPPRAVRNDATLRRVINDVTWASAPQKLARVR